MAEIPSAILTYFLLKSVGRRTAISLNSIIMGVSLLISSFIPTHYTLLIRICFSIGMMATSSALAVVYVFTAEIWPTAHRNTLMNICSMIGRIGSMLAPLTILLVSKFRIFSSELCSFTRNRRKKTNKFTILIEIVAFSFISFRIKLSPRCRFTYFVWLALHRRGWFSYYRKQKINAYQTHSMKHCNSDEYVDFMLLMLMLLIVVLTEKVVLLFCYLHELHSRNLTTHQIK